MDRRNMMRLDVELTCYVGSARVIARPFKAVTKNVSRNGMLMRWNRENPTPVIGKKITVDLELPENSEFGPRMMQCSATVVRVEEETPDYCSVALKVHSMKFVETPVTSRGSIAETDLAKMPMPTSRAM